MSIPDLISQLVALEEKATKGPWTVVKDEIHAGDIHVVCFGHDYYDYVGFGADDKLMGCAGGKEYTEEWFAPWDAQKEANAELITALRNAFPEIIAALSAKQQGGEGIVRPIMIDYNEYLDRLRPFRALLQEALDVLPGRGNLRRRIIQTLGESCGSLPLGTQRERESASEPGNLLRKEASAFESAQDRNTPNESVNLSEPCPHSGPSEPQRVAHPYPEAALRSVPEKETVEVPREPE